MKPRFNHHVPWALQSLGNYVWTGISLRDLLNHVGVKSTAVDLVMTGVDAGVTLGQLRHFQRSIEVSDPSIDYCMLCWQHNGVDLLPQHGQPLRLIHCGWYGMSSVKWLHSIELVDYKFTGYEMTGYTYSKAMADKALEFPTQEMRPRAMMKPVGWPSFVTRARTVKHGQHEIVGRAWTGGGYYRDIVAVYISFDDGTTWQQCKLYPRIGTFSWHKFTYTWNATPGRYVCRVRGVDDCGHTQKVTLNVADWNYRGMADDACQREYYNVVKDIEFTT